MTMSRLSLFRPASSGAQKGNAKKLGLQAGFLEKAQILRNVDVDVIGRGVAIVDLQRQGATLRGHRQAGQRSDQPSAAPARLLP